MLSVCAVAVEKEAVLTNGHTSLHCKLPSLFSAVSAFIFNLELNKIIIILLTNILKILSK